MDRKSQIFCNGHDKKIILGMNLIVCPKVPLRFGSVCRNNESSSVAVFRNRGIVVVSVVGEGGA